jgi:hypothetical protein
MGYQLIETIEVGAGGAASIEFTGIPQDGVDLQVVLSSRINSTGTFSQFYVYFNNSTANYSGIRLYGTGSSVATSTVSWAGALNGGTSTANTFGNSQTLVSNYTSSSFKSFTTDSVSEDNASTAIQALHGNLWSDTSAITSLKLVPLSNSFVYYTTASLYKITA